MKELYIALFSILVMTLCTSCLADLRPKSIKGNGATIDNQASIALLRASKAHGYSNWSKMREYECILRDSFIGFVGKRGSPFEENQATLKSSFSRGTKNGSLTILTGKHKGHIWTNTGKRASIIHDGEIIDVDSEIARFWVPTYQYFIEFPFRIIEATALKKLKDKNRNGKNYQRVLASWNTIEPQKTIDQYIVWINEDMIIDYIEYTIRDQYTFLKGSAEYVQYDVVNEIFFPSQIDVYSNLTGRKMLHQMKISQVEIVK